jgi:hypothetical protein
MEFNAQKVPNPNCRRSQRSAFRDIDDVRCTVPHLAGSLWEAIRAPPELLSRQREGRIKRNGVLPRTHWPHVEGVLQSLGSKGKDRQLRKAFFAAIFSQTLFFCTSSPGKLVREGVVASLGKEQTADRLHIHSGIFSCSLVF